MVAAFFDNPNKNSASIYSSYTPPPSYSPPPVPKEPPKPPPDEEAEKLREKLRKARAADDVYKEEIEKEIARGGGDRSTLDDDTAHKVEQLEELRRRQWARTMEGLQE